MDYKAQYTDKIVPCITDLHCICKRGFPNSLIFEKVKEIAETQTEFETETLFYLLIKSNKLFREEVKRLSNTMEQDISTSSEIKSFIESSLNK